MGAVAVSFLTMLVVEKPSTVGTISTRPPYGKNFFVADDGSDGIVAAFDEDIGLEGRG